MNAYIYINKVVEMVVCVLLFHLFTFSPLTADAKKHKQLVILHTNDTTIRNWQDGAVSCVGST